MTKQSVADELWPEIKAVVAKYKSDRSALITVLRLCQEITGFFQKDLLLYIAKEMDIPQSEVFGTVSFYSLFSLTPKGRHSIKACTGTACYVKGIREIIHRIEGEYDISCGETTKDLRFDLEGVRCLGACGLAPVVNVGQEVHGDVTADSILDLLKHYT